MCKTEDKYIWTSHALAKMRHYKMSASVVKRIVRHPDRVEESVVEDCIAAMKLTQSKQYPEAWVIYKPVKDSTKSNSKGKLKILTSWKYPGISKERNAIPENVLKEIRGILGF